MTDPLIRQWQHGDGPFTPHIDWPAFREVEPRPRCKCSHGPRDHGTDRRDRPRCFGSNVCACTTFRPEDPK